MRFFMTLTMRLRKTPDQWPDRRLATIRRSVWRCLAAPVARSRVRSIRQDHRYFRTFRLGDLMQILPFQNHRARARSRGQSLAEFALVFPILFLVVAAIIQFGLVFWAQNTLTQVARDTGRWAATQQSCDPSTATPSVVATANSIAASSSLFGYTSVWSSPTNVQVAWSVDTTSPPRTCPPVGNQQVAYVTITLHHTVPMFFPFLPLSNNLTTQAQFRMEPVSK